MIRKYGTISEMNIAMDTEFVNWNAFEVRPEYYLPRRNQYLNSSWYREIQAFKIHQKADGIAAGAAAKAVIELLVRVNTEGGGFFLVKGA